MIKASFRTIILIVTIIVGAGAAFAGSHPDSDYMIAFKDKKSKLYGYFNANTGQIVISPQYKEATILFNEGRAVVSHMENGKAVKKSYDIIRPDGSVVFTINFDPKYSALPEYTENGWLWLDNVRYDTEGRAQTLPEGFVSYARHQDALYNFPGYVRAKAHGIKKLPLAEPLSVTFGYVSIEDMGVKIPFDYEILGEFVDGWAYYRQGNETGVIDTTGHKVHIFPEKYYINLPFGGGKEGDYRVQRAQFNENRLWIIPHKVDDKGKIKNGDYWIAVDRNFQRVIDPENPIKDILGPFSEGVAPVSFRDEIKDKNWYTQQYVVVFIDTLGNVVSPEPYLSANSFCNYGDGVVRALINVGKINSPSWGFIDRDFNQTVPAIYSDIDGNFNRFTDGTLFVRAKTKNYWGVIDLNNNVLIPLKYDYLGEFVNDKAYAQRKINGQTRGMFVDRNGNELMLSQEIPTSSSMVMMYDRPLCIFYPTPDRSQYIIVDVNTGEMAGAPQ